MTVDICECGAVGDGETLNTEAIRRAVEKCVAAGGGRVTVPAGRFVTGTIVLKSNIELHLSAGAKLLGSTKIGDYLDLDGGHPKTLYNTPIIYSYYRRPLIYAENAENVAITGTGEIDGQSGWKINFPNEGDETNSRPILIIMHKVNKLKVHDVTLRDPSMWTTRFERCENVDVRGVTIRSMRTNNGDGLDFVGGKNIRIADCDIEAGDDCISLKMFCKEDEIRNVTVTDCTFKSWWCAFRIGGETDGNCSEVTVNNCTVDCSGDGIKIHSCGGSVVENMNFSNICMRNVERPVFAVADTYTFCDAGRSRPAGSVIRNISFSQITAVHRHDRDYEKYVGDKIAGSVISGSYSGRVENIRFDNVYFEAEGGVSDSSLGDPVVYEFTDYMDKYAEAREFRRPCVPASGLFLRRVENCTFRNVRFASRLPDARPRMIALRCENCLFDISAKADELCGRPVIYDLCEGSSFTGCNPRPFTEEEQRRERENDRTYSAVAAAQEREGALVDAARKMPRKMKVPFEKTQTGGKVVWELSSLPARGYIYFAWAKGRAEFICNGKKVGEHKFPRAEGYKNIMIDITEAPEGGVCGVFCERYGDFYEREYYCAFDVTERLVQGRNALEVLSEDFDAVWEVWFLYE